MKISLSCILFACMLHISPAGSNVYICDSKSAKAYHSSKTCSGIKKCTHTILEVTLKDAKEKYERVACKICY